MQDTLNSIYPARRFVILGREFGRRSLDITALSEVRLQEDVFRKDVGFTFHWRGKPGEAKECGNGFAIKFELIHRLEVPRGISVGIMVRHLFISNGRYPPT